jgi:hypothetical protein
LAALVDTIAGEGEATVSYLTPEESEEEETKTQMKANTDMAFELTCLFYKEI